MKIRNNIRNIYFNILVKIYKKKISDNNFNKVCILPASRHGNLGDEAMVIALSTALKNKGNELSIIEYDNTDKWMLSYNSLFLKRISLPKHFFQWKKFISFLSNHKYLYINGADVLDGKYSEASSLYRLNIASLASKLGLETIITGFSFNKTPSRNIINFIQKMPINIQFCCRDIYSHERFTSLTKKEATQVADLAFLLENDKNSYYAKLVKIWADKKKQEGKYVISLTPNALFIKYSMIDLKKSYAYILHELNKYYNCSFILIPHDYRNSPNDVDCIKEIESECKNLDLLIIDKPCSASEMKEIARNINFCISGRMHFAIACLSMGIPCCGICYQDKFDGLFKLLGLESSLIDISLLNRKRDSVDKIKNIINDRMNKQKLEKNLPLIIKLSLKNII